MTLQGCRRAVAALAMLLGSHITLHAAPAPVLQQTCVDVTAGSAESYDCLNQALAERTAGQHRPSSATDAPMTATSPGNVTGQFNEGATRNRLGSSFGHSVTPPRPSYAPPAGLPRPH